MSDTIFIKGLLIHARHGVMDHEAEVGQRFVIEERNILVDRVPVIVRVFIGPADGRGNDHHLLRMRRRRSERQHRRAKCDDQRANEGDL